MVPLPYFLSNIRAQHNRFLAFYTKLAIKQSFECRCLFNLCNIPGDQLSLIFSNSFIPYDSQCPKTWHAVRIHQGRLISFYITIHNFPSKKMSGLGVFRDDNTAFQSRPLLGATSNNVAGFFWCGRR